MSKQFEQLEILYRQILVISKEIKELISKSDYDGILSQEEYKTQLISRVTLAQKTVTLSEEENEIIKNMRAEIAKSEEENLNLMKRLRDSTLIELKALNNQSKITNKYMPPSEPQEGSICDYTSD